MFDKERLGSHPPTPQELRAIIPNQNLPYKRLIALNSAPLHSRIDTDVDAISGEILEKIPNELRREREDEVRKTVNRDYQGLHITRFGRLPYKVDIILYFTCKTLETYLPQDFLEVMEEKRFRGFKFILRQYLKRKYGDWKLQCSQDKYVNRSFDFEAWQRVLTIKFSLDNKHPLPLFEQANEVAGYVLYEQGKQLGLATKNGFFVCLSVYSIRKLEKIKGKKFLKSNKDVCKAFQIPEKTFKRRMNELYFLDCN